jgi:cytochrome c551
MKNFGFTWGFLIIIISFYSCQTAQEVKKTQYFAEGLELYKTHCANCHQINGTGLEGLYPPIAPDFLKNNKLRMICYMHNGSNDSSTVNGKKYTQIMPANKTLELLDLAEITTYVYNKWGIEKTITEITEVETALASCGKNKDLSKK